MNRDVLLLRPLARFTDFSLLALRLLAGAFLVHGVWDNVVSRERMAEFTGFLAANAFPAPAVMAALAVYAQLSIGVALIVGLLTRLAGLLLALTFVVAVAMVHWHQTFREIWPAAVLVTLGLIFATIGAGRFSMDAMMERRP